MMTIMRQKRWRKRGLWLIGSTGVTFMVAWDWKLVLATITGVILMVLIYQIQEGNLHSRWLYYREILSGLSGKLILAVSAGGLGAIVVYIAASIWATTENYWLAIGFIIQGIGTIFSLGLFLWQAIQVRAKNDENKLNQLVLDLTNTDPLKRLIAVRSLVDFLYKQCFEHHYHHRLKDYFNLMLTQETESLIRREILEGLAKYNEWQQLPNLGKDTTINLK